MMDKQPGSLMQGGKTGWPPGLLQDDSRELSRWFSSRPDARAVVDRVVAEILAARARPNVELSGPPR